ncbi:unnamed protein product [Pseudo-nitzschia multistriata]|uniref:Uncharacterized protein n=1 Tax=Pseudo-nitzschia multistriata TaxID=183589 RepID=A0A448ZSZ2_9STRA|nr:unnamed protein product [Pseudo-nitzschia multistriata]
MDAENGLVHLPPQGSYYGSKRSGRPINSTEFETATDRDRYSYPNRVEPDAPELYVFEEDVESGVTSINSRGYDSGFESSIMGKSNAQREINDEEDDLLSQQRSQNNYVGDGDSVGKLSMGKPPTTDVTIVRNRSGGKPVLVSRSRLETVERMEKNANNSSETTAQMIDDLLTDLDKSFNDDSYKQ